MKISAEKVTIRQPDDWHLHLRDGDLLKTVLKHTSRTFRRAVIMPNLRPPITSIKEALSYRKRILQAIPSEHSFDPLMTAYLTEELSAIELEAGFSQKVFVAAKLYPANVTTNSSQGVRDIKSIDYLFETMERIGMPLLIHGEVTDKNIDIFDREKYFIDRELIPLLERFPELKIVLEHITTKQAVQFVDSSGHRLAATITPHHLHINRNAMFDGGFRSDFYCLPVAKRENHRQALRSAATSGKSCFFLGTDSAPHLRTDKESACGCAGIFNAPFALESYATVFEEEGCLDRLEAFASEFGPAFYGMPLNQTFVSLRRSPHIVPKRIDLINKRNSSDYLVPFHAGESLDWMIQ